MLRIFGVILAMIVTARAETVAWWRFEVPRGNYLDTLVSETNSPQLDSTLGQNGVYLTPEGPGKYVSDGAKGKKIENTQSLLENASEPNLLKNEGATNTLNGVFVGDKKSWTWEAFIYLRPSFGSVPYGMLFGNGSKDAHGIQFDLGSDGSHLRLLSNGGVIVEGPVLHAERWYHVAVVGERKEADWDIRLYVDHEEVTGKDGVELDTVDGDYGIAGPMNPLDGYVDEMRLSRGALKPDEMLQASN